MDFANLAILFGTILAPVRELFSWIVHRFFVFGTKAAALDLQNSKICHFGKLEVPEDYDATGARPSAP